MAKIDIDEKEYPSNSKSDRSAPMREGRKRIKRELVEEEKPLQRTISGKALRKKKTLSQSIAESFIGDGENPSVVQYILYEVLLPAAKTTIQDMVTGGIEMLLFGETRGGSRSRGRDRDRSTVSYGSFYRGRDRDEERRNRVRARDKFDLDEIYFKHGDDAAEVLEQMCEALEEYEAVTVADYFELAGIDGATWAHNKYGWTDLRRAKCTHTRHGYAIILPPPIELDD